MDDLNIKSSGMFTSELMEGIKALKSAIIQIHVRDKNFVFLKGNKKGVRAVLFIIDDLNEIPLGVCYILWCESVYHMIDLDYTVWLTSTSTLY